MRFASLLLLAGCWSESTFRDDCVKAGHCTVDDASVDSGLDAGADAGVDGGLDAGADAGVTDGGDAGGTTRCPPPSSGAWASHTWAEVKDALFTLDAGPGDFTSALIETNDTSATDRWVGAVLTRSGAVICIPSSADKVLEICPDDSFHFLPYTKTTSVAWEGGVLLPDGTVMGLPADASNVLLIPPDGGPVQTRTLELPVGSRHFEGGVVTTNGVVLLATGDGTDLFVLPPPWTAVRPVGATPVRPSNVVDHQYAGAVLLASGDRAYLVPRGQTSIALVSETGSTFFPARAGLAGGLLMPDDRALLMPNLSSGTVFTNGSGITTGADSATSYFSAAWSTNGYAYAIQTDTNGSGNVLIIDRQGAVLEAATHPGLSRYSHFGLVARADGTLVACPYQSSKIFVLRPTTRRTLPIDIMASPWLNKW
jgi:hypothetical protein